MPLVKAKFADRPVPTERHKPGMKMIDSVEAVDVPDTLYYRRQIACGDLLIVTAPAPEAKE